MQELHRVALADRCLVLERQSAGCLAHHLLIVPVVPVVSSWFHSLLGAESTLFSRERRSHLRQQSAKTKMPWIMINHGYSITAIPPLPGQGVIFFVVFWCVFFVLWCFMCLLTILNALWSWKKLAVEDWHHLGHWRRSQWCPDDPGGSCGHRSGACADSGHGISASSRHSWQRRKSGGAGACSFDLIWIV